MSTNKITSWTAKCHLTPQIFPFAHHFPGRYAGLQIVELPSLRPIYNMTRQCNPLTRKHLWPSDMDFQIYVARHHPNDLRVQVPLCKLILNNC